MIQNYTVEMPGGIVLPGDAARYGKIFLGSLGTGKSSFIEGELRAAVRNGKPVIAVDYEGSLAHRLRAVGPPAGYEIHRVDVTVQGGTALDIPAMWHTQTNRIRWARKISPMQKGNPNSFFDAFAQEIDLASSSFLDKWSRGRATLADQVRLSDEPELLDALGDLAPEIGSPYRLTGVFSRAGKDIRATVRTKHRPLMVYAALSLHAVRLVNPLDLVHNPRGMAVVLVFKDRYRAVMEKVFSFVLDTVIEEKLSLPGGEQLHVSLDEVGSIAQLETLPDLVRRGRKSNICYYLSAQSIEQVLRRYGREDGSDILELPAYKVFTKLPGKRSAQWASDMLGVCEVLEDTAPRPYMAAMPREGSEYRRTVKERHNVPWYELARLPLASYEDDQAFGYIDTPKTTKQFTAKFRHLIDTKEPASVFEQVPAEWEILPALTPEDKGTRLRLPGEALRRAAEQRERNRRRVQGEQQGEEGGEQ